jgi:hypothetical protein
VAESEPSAGMEIPEAVTGFLEVEDHEDIESGGAVDVFPCSRVVLGAQEAASRSLRDVEV